MITEDVWYGLVMDLSRRERAGEKPEVVYLPEDEWLTLQREMDEWPLAELPWHHPRNDDGTVTLWGVSIREATQ